MTWQRWNQRQTRSGGPFSHTLGLQKLEIEASTAQHFIMMATPTHTSHAAHAVSTLPSLADQGRIAAGECDMHPAGMPLKNTCGARLLHGCPGLSPVSGCHSNDAAAIARPGLGALDATLVAQLFKRTRGIQFHGTVTSLAHAHRVGTKADVTLGRQACEYTVQYLLLHALASVGGIVSLYQKMGRPREF